jgi:hypothetical protein
VKARGTSTVAEARRRMLRVADLYEAAEQELRAIGRLLDRDVAVVAQRRAAKAPGPDDWFERLGAESYIADGISATLESYDLTEAAGLLRKDARPGGAERELEVYKFEQREDAVRRASRRRAA